MDIPQRTHVVPLMYEFDRVLEPPVSLKADRVVLVVHDEREWPHPDYYGTIRERLVDGGVRVEERECDMLDLYTCLGAVAGAISDYPDDEVYVNVATGSKIMTIAGMIASMTSGATPYYVHARDYSPDGELPPEEPMSHGVAGVEEIPDYPIDSPSVEHLQVLEHLEAAGPQSKKELIGFCEREEMSFLSDYEGSNVKGKYRLLDSRLLSDLSEGGFVTNEAVGRTVQIGITEKGRNSLRAYRHQLG